MSKEDTQFKPGNDGGPGRPKGARNKLSDSFIQALADDFEKKGIEAVELVRMDKPEAYLNVIGRLMPKIMELSGPEGGSIPVSGTVVFRKASEPSDS